MKIAIDDTRTLMFCDIVFRTPYSLLDYSKTDLWQKVKEIYFDHDLGIGVLTGLQVMAMLYDDNKFPANIKIITANLEGRKNMIAFLVNDCGYVKDGMDMKYTCNISKEQFTVTTMVRK